MDISFNTINYLMSNSRCKKLQEKHNCLNKEINHELRNDTKFYKKRIYQITKDLIRKKIDGNTIDKNLDELFTSYLHGLIEHFKFDDKKDILQEEFKNMNNKKVHFSFNKIEEINADEYIMKRSEIKSNTIEDCMNITIKKPEKKKPILPKEKIINLKSPELKNKGLKKKSK
tara:strand:+ start:1617 stop:2132 length:516 start_codon:yes stop_codon:yes gene_type:complete